MEKSLFVFRETFWKHFGGFILATVLARAPGRDIRLARGQVCSEFRLEYTIGSSYLIAHVLHYPPNPSAVSSSLSLPSPLSCWREKETFIYSHHHRPRAQQHQLQTRPISLDSEDKADLNKDRARSLMRLRAGSRVDGRDDDGSQSVIGD